MWSIQKRVNQSVALSFNRSDTVVASSYRHRILQHSNQYSSSSSSNNTTTNRDKYTQQNERCRSCVLSSIPIKLSPHLLAPNFTFHTTRSRGFSTTPNNKNNPVNKATDNDKTQEQKNKSNHTQAPNNTNESKTDHSNRSETNTTSAQENTNTNERASEAVDGEEITEMEPIVEMIPREGAIYTESYDPLIDQFKYGKKDIHKLIHEMIATDSERNLINTPRESPLDPTIGRTWSESEIKFMLKELFEYTDKQLDLIYTPTLNITNLQQIEDLNDAYDEQDPDEPDELEEFLYEPSGHHDLNTSFAEHKYYTLLRQIDEDNYKRVYNARDYRVDEFLEASEIDWGDPDDMSNQVKNDEIEQVLPFGGYLDQDISMKRPDDDLIEEEEEEEEEEKEDEEEGDENANNIDGTGSVLARQSNNQNQKQQQQQQLATDETQDVAENEDDVEMANIEYQQWRADGENLLDEVDDDSSYVAKASTRLRDFNGAKDTVNNLSQSNDDANAQLEQDPDDDLDLSDKRNLVRALTPNQMSQLTWDHPRFNIDDESTNLSRLLSPNETVAKTISLAPRSPGPDDPWVTEGLALSEVPLRDMNETMSEKLHPLQYGGPLDEENIRDIKSIDDDDIPDEALYFRERNLQYDYSTHDEKTTMIRARIKDVEFPPVVFRPTMVGVPIQVENVIYHLHMSDPVQWSQRHLAETFRLSVPRIRAIIAIHAIDRAKAASGEFDEMERQIMESSGVDIDKYRRYLVSAKLDPDLMWWDTDADPTYKHEYHQGTLIVDDHVAKKMRESEAKRLATKREFFVQPRSAQAQPLNRDKTDTSFKLRRTQRFPVVISDTSTKNEDLAVKIREVDGSIRHADRDEVTRAIQVERPYRYDRNYVLRSKTSVAMTISDLEP